MLKKLFLLFVGVCSLQLLFSQDNPLKSFPKGSTPKEVGKRLADHFVGSRHDLYFGQWVHYASVCSWNGAIDYALKVNDKKLIKQLENKFEPFFTYEKALLPPMNHVDYNMFGSLALKLYQINKDERYKELGL